MNDSQRKYVAIAAAVVALLAVSSQFLAGQKLAPSPLIASPTLPVSPLLGTTSTQPKITWSTTSINVIVSPGESTSSNITFTSSLPLSNATLSVVPQISPFVMIQPAAYASVPANQPEPVQLSISIPTGTAFATYKGTLQLKSSTTTFPQTVKIVVNVWQQFTDTSVGITFKYPTTLAIDERSVDGGTEIFAYFPGQTNEPPQFAIQTFNFTPSGSAILQDIATLRLGSAIISETSFLQGLLVSSSTLSPLHYFQYSSATERGLDVYGASPDLFASSTFSTVMSTVRF